MNNGISCSNIGAKLGGVDVLRGINANFPSGKWTAIIGPNGAGKSTFLKALAGLLKYVGDVSVEDVDIKKIPARVKAKKIAWLGQNEGGADDLCAYDVAMLGRLPHQGWLALPSDLDHQAVERALRQTQAWDWRLRPLGSLSGGERQRVLLARMLAVEAKFLLMDEPITNLDPPHQTDWLETVQHLVGNGTTVISVLHEVTLALRADSLLVLDNGQVRHHGSCTEPSTHDAIVAVFDQRIEILKVGDAHVALPRLSLPIAQR